IVAWRGNARSGPIVPMRASMRSTALPCEASRGPIPADAGRAHPNGSNLMRKIRLTAFVSMDGVMQAPGGPDEDRDGGFEHGGWTVSYWDEPMGRFMDRTFDTPFDLLLGRRTYDIFAAHWPRVPDSDPIAKSFNTVTKYVATHRP